MENQENVLPPPADPSGQDRTSISYLIPPVSNRDFRTILFHLMLLIFVISWSYNLHLTHTEIELNYEWNLFKITFGKVYNNAEEEYKAKEIFKYNLKYNEQHNEKYENNEVPYKLGINKFADQTADRLLPAPDDNNNFQSQYMFNLPPFGGSLKKDKVGSYELMRPMYKDWRDDNVISPVKDQGNCGSCWAFAVIDTMEAQLQIHQKKNISLSVQQLIDCDSKSNGCEGGLLTTAFDYIIDNGGVNTEEDYPYEEAQKKCRYNSQKDHYNVLHYRVINDVDGIMTAVATTGPVAVGFLVCDDILRMDKGIYETQCDSQKRHHAMVIVGYGSEEDNKGQMKDFWIVKNSWGAKWGSDNGFVKMARDKKQSNLLQTVYPIVPLKESLIYDVI